MAFNSSSPVGAYQNQPTNINFLSPHRFRVILHRAPSLMYFVQKANLPSINMGSAIQPTPMVDIPIPGDKVQYGDFVMTFPIDEDMKNYREIADWMVGLGFPKQFGQYKDLAKNFEGIRSDISLIVLDSAHNPQHIIRYKNAYPVSLSEIEFDSTITDVPVITVTATFKYVLWEFDEVNIGTSTVTEADGLNR